MKRLIGVIQFMTTIPIPIDTGKDEAFHKGVIYFPIVGMILGVLYYIIGTISAILFNPYIGAVMIIVSEVVLTGGLHLDGLGDTFDGLYSYREKERMLEIMKDSRLGTNGLLAIMLVLLLKLGFIYTLLEKDFLWMIIVMPVIARSMQVVACYKTKTPRERGMGNLFIGKVSTLSLLGTLIISMAIIGGTLYIVGEMTTQNVLIQLACSLFLIVGVRVFIKTVYRKIDGITGDVLGCICELTELGYLLIIYLMYGL